MSDLPNVALIGRMGSGKSTAAQLLTEHLGYRRLSFAGLHEGGLRDVALRIWGEDARNDRAKLQFLGMAVRRIDPDAWVNAAIRELRREHELAEPQPVAVDDLRFPNEALALKAENFIVIRLRAGRNERVARLQANAKLQNEDQLEHESESALDKWPHDYDIINERKTQAELLDELTRTIALDQKAMLA